MAINPIAKAGDTSSALPKPHVPHLGETVRVGPYEVMAAGTMYDLDDRFDDPNVVLVPLTDTFPGLIGQEYHIVYAALPDYGGVPDNWGEFLKENILPRLASGQKLLAFCVGSHGRTGVFLASLIALLESSEETPDPIVAARQRHCEKAVESFAQAQGVFALRGQPVPAHYRKSLHR
ncbi:MAG: hypothetical protein JWM07_93 [Candidatus Saccharibacteria bacterium]|jgi:hypothetical protein|nr:hypothetical protein [Candidatus Saccharibacteria bacterium]